MLKNCSQEDIARIAKLAKTARAARDRLLSGIPEGALGEPQPMRGPRDPASSIGLDPLPPDHPARRGLEQAITALSDEARSELQALVWIGRGDYGAGQWDEAVAAASQATRPPPQTLAASANLHEYIEKGLYAVAAVVPKVMPKDAAC